MTPRGFMRLSGILIMSLLFLSGCNPFAKNSTEVRYKIGVEVDTPDGIRSGSSVWSISLSKPGVALASGYNSKFRGEAVAVDLPNGKTLFALTGQAQIPERQFRELRKERKGEDRVADLHDIASNVGVSKELPCAKRTGEERGADRADYRFDCVRFVSFEDITDPLTVFAVDRHDAAASLGEGYAIKAITVTITDEPITTGIEKRLGWLAKYYDRQFSGDRYQSIQNKHKGLSAYISAGAFSSEIKSDNKGKSE